MQKIILYSLISFIAQHVSCQDKKHVVISYELSDSISGNNLRILKVITYNQTDKNVYILAGALVSKLDRVHPCRERLVGEYSRIGSHQDFDCQIDMGDPLFTYLKTEPSYVHNLMKLKEALRVKTGSGEFDSWFYYLRPNFKESHPIPYFIFLKAHQATGIYFKTAANLNFDDKGDYQLSWFSNEEIKNIIELRKGNNMTFKDLAKKITVNGFKYYDKDLIINPVIIRL